MISGSSVGLILFDNDGVLVDSEPIACEAVAEALHERGLKVTALEICERYIGISAASMYRGIENQYGISISLMDRETINRAVDHRLATTVPAMRGVIEAIELMGSHHTLCVASSGSPGRITGSLSHAGLLTYFNGRIFSASQVENGKPAPDLFLFAAASMGFIPDDCLVVEDSIPGVAAAKAAGMRCLGFVGGGHIREGHTQLLLDAGAIKVFDCMGKLADFVEREF